MFDPKRKTIGEMSFWHYTRKERLGILVLVAVYLLLLVLPDYLDLFLPVPPVPLPEKAWWNPGPKDSMMASHGEVLEMNRRNGETDSLALTGKRPFDPNTISESEWLSMGLPRQLANRLMHYRGKGGRFRKAADIRRIYGMTDELYRSLAPWVRIHDTVDSAGKKVWGSPQSGSLTPLPRVINNELISIDVNNSDSSDWIALKGIGQVLARRIIRFREKLGGFYAVDQVAETYGLPDSVFNSIKPRLSCAGESLKKVKINSDSLKVLEQHPYIGRTIARQLLRYREQHGPFTGTESLLTIESLDRSWIDKMRPYLDFK
jgi:DNA uptake protein ComE-like DNA-binding protein